MTSQATPARRSRSPSTRLRPPLKRRRHGRERPPAPRRPRPGRYDLAEVKANGELQVFRDGKVIDLRDGDKFVSVIFGVEVNDTFVELDKRKQTGRTLKGPRSRPASRSSRTSSSRRSSRAASSRSSPTTREITVKYHDEFWAIPGDDNS